MALGLPHEVSQLPGMEKVGRETNKRFSQMSLPSACKGAQQRPIKCLYSVGVSSGNSLEAAGTT